LLPQQTLTDEGLAIANVMVKVESIISSCPLTPVVLDPDREEPLILNHLLLMRASPNLPTGDFSSSDTSSRTGWRQVQYILPTSYGLTGNANIWKNCKVGRSGRCLRTLVLSMMWCLCMTSMLQEVNGRSCEWWFISIDNVMCGKCSCVGPPVTSNDRRRNCVSCCEKAKIKFHTTFLLLNAGQRAFLFFFLSCPHAEVKNPFS